MFHALLETFHALPNALAKGLEPRLLKAWPSPPVTTFFLLESRQLRVYSITCCLSRIPTGL